MATLYVTDIESAINWWRERSPSPDGITACTEVRALATPYALMAYDHELGCDEASLSAAARDAWLAFGEVQHWTGMSPAEKRATWHRITMAGTAWRFNRYAERAGDDRAAVAQPADTLAGITASTPGRPTRR